MSASLQLDLTQQHTRPGPRGGVSGEERRTGHCPKKVNQMFRRRGTSECAFRRPRATEARREERRLATTRSPFPSESNVDSPTCGRLPGRATCPEHRVWPCCRNFAHASQECDSPQGSVLTLLLFISTRESSTRRLSPFLQTCTRACATFRAWHRLYCCLPFRAVLLPLVLARSATMRGDVCGCSWISQGVTKEPACDDGAEGLRYGTAW